MKAIVQRVLKASVVVDDQIISSIKNGLCILVGINKDDTDSDLNYLVQKILNTKFFEDESGKRWKASVKDKQYEVLCISQFTLYHTFKGNKLDFHRAMTAEDAEKFYNKFLESLRQSYRPDAIKDGKFGAMMKVEIINDGPVTIEVDSQNR